MLIVNQHGANSSFAFWNFLETFFPNISTCGWLHLQKQILLCSWILWVRASDRAERGQLVFVLWFWVLSWEEGPGDSMAEGWNQMETSSLICLAADVGHWLGTPTRGLSVWSLCRACLSPESKAEVYDIFMIWLKVSWQEKHVGWDYCRHLWKIQSATVVDLTSKIAKSHKGLSLMKNVHEWSCFWIQKMRSMTIK